MKKMLFLFFLAVSLCVQAEVDLFCENGLGSFEIAREPQNGGAIFEWVFSGHALDHFLAKGVIDKAAVKSGKGVIKIGPTPQGETPVSFSYTMSGQPYRFIWEKDHWSNGYFIRLYREYGRGDREISAEYYFHRCLFGRQFYLD